MSESVVQPQDKFVARLPEGLRDEIKLAARDNARSMNSEIVSRLQNQKISLRDHFATAALSGIVAAAVPKDCALDTVWCAREAYELADAMLKAREGTE